ncbi:MAG: isopentenyl phosphate kinase [Candidatus Bathyarchaeota archaeon]|nr:isopentenyl phosphate kinase [Candidatus Bathyarchaeota archaeon]
MSEAKPTILKIGGSVITDKNGELAAKTEAINRIAEEIKRADMDNLVVVHGGGSFGHPTAQKYNISEGLKEDSQKVGFSETHHVMTVLNGLVMDAFVWHEIPSLSVTPSSCITTEDGRIKTFEDSIVCKCMQMGFVPVLYGDAVFDQKKGFTVLSGDQLVAYLATKLKAQKIVIGVDTDGLFDSDPKTNSEAQRYPRLTLDELKELQGKIGKAQGTDVTGGMAGKISELIPAIEQGIPVKIVNASRGQRVYRALADLNIEGTLIEKKA